MPAQKTPVFPKIPLIPLLVIAAAILMAVEIKHDLLRYKKMKKNASASAETLQNIPSGTLNFHGTDYPLEKPAGVYRIIILGGSAAEGYGVEIKKSWGSLLGAQLESLEPGQKIEVINMAQGAFTSIDDYVNFVKEGVYLNPDLVIVYGGWNDMIAYLSNPGWIAGNTESRLGEIHTNSISHGIQEQFKNRFYLLRKYQTILHSIEQAVTQFYGFLQSLRGQVFEWLRKNLRLPYAQFAAYFMAGGDSASKFDSFEAVMAARGIQENHLGLYPKFAPEIRALYESYYRANLESLAKIIRSKKIRAVFVLQPDLAHQAARRALTPKETEIARKLLGNDTEKWMAAVKDYYPRGAGIMRDTAIRNGFIFVNMDEALALYPAEKLFQDNVHNTPEGNQVISKILTGTVRPLLSVKENAHAV